MTVPVANIQRFCTHDGPGVRTTVFLKGCPLRCAWCHNPETQSPRPQVLYTPQSCIGCGQCVEVCINGAHDCDPDRGHRFDASRCKGCVVCTEVCPSNALAPAGRDMMVEEIMEIVLRDRAFYGKDGGVTLSGGEPLIYAEACIEILNCSKAYGISTAIETSGYFERSYIARLAAVTDLFLWDFKDGHAERHRLYTGVSNDKIIQNLLDADRYAKEIILRCIMVKGVNMDSVNYTMIADVFSRLRHCAGVELIPYHAYGGSKQAQLGFDDDGRPEWIPSAEEMDRAKELLIRLGCRVIDGSGRPVPPANTVE